MDRRGFDTIQTIISEHAIEAVTRPPVAEGSEVKYFGVQLRQDYSSEAITALTTSICANFAQVEFTSLNKKYCSFVDHAVTDRI